MKKIKNNTLKIIGYIFSAKIFSYFVRLIASIIIARNLGPEGRGMISAAMIIPEIIASFGHFGLPISNIYFIGKGKNKSILLVNSLFFILVASSIYLFLSILLFPLYQETYYGGINSTISIVSLTLIILLISKHFLLYFLRGLEKYNFFNFASIIQPLTKLICIIFFVFNKRLTIENAIIASMISILILDIYSFTKVKKYIPKNFLKINNIQFLESFKYGLKEYIGNVFMVLNSKVDMIILVSLISKSSLGIYAISRSLSELFIFIPSSISVVLYPKISKSTNQQNSIKLVKKSIILNLIVLLPLLFLFYCFGQNFIIFIYGREFSYSYSLSIVLLLGTLFLSISQLINKFFSGVGRPEIKSFIRIITLPVKVISLLYFVKFYDLYGAAWSFTLTHFFILILSIYFILKIKNEVK